MIRVLAVLLFVPFVATASAQSWPVTRGVHALEADMPGAGRVLYAVSVPNGYKPGTPAPLVMVLHPGGQGPRYYGGQFMRGVVEPALRSMRPIMIAPDCTARAWSEAQCDTAVTALMDQAMKAYTIDRKRVLVVGFSMGGRGTWHMASKHPELFTAAIPMAASTRGMSIDDLGKQPTYVIHSRADEVVPFEPAEETASALKKLKRTVHFEAVEDLTHFEMVNYVDALRDAARWVVERWKE
jgi:predicted peptidase